MKLGIITPLFLAAFAAIQGCFPAKVVEAPVVEVQPRSCERWFRFEEGTPKDVQEIAREGAYSLAGFTHGRVRIAFGEQGKDEFVAVPEGSDRAARIDYLYGTAASLPEGLTTGFDDGSPEGRARVEVLPWRTPEAKRWRVITHELAHACGMMDVLEVQNVMTGAEPRNLPPVTTFGEADFREARDKGF